MLASLRLILFPLLALALSFPAEAATQKKKSTSTATKASAGTTVRRATAAKPTPAATPAIDVNGVPITRAGSVLVIDPQSGRILHEKNADQLRPAASTQKLLTALVIVEAGGLDEELVVQPSDTWAEPTKLGFRAGESYTRRELLEVLLVHSMNDAAVALARDNAGNVELFAAKMNQRAAMLGMTSSRFVNPNGLPAPGQYSTARDLARLAQAAYYNRTIRNIVMKQTVTFRYASGRVATFQNTNRVLGRNPYCNGMKTGYTDAAGKCLIASGTNGGRDVIAVLLGDTISSIWRDAANLLAWGLSA